jgi:hypothetical protein
MVFLQGLLAPPSFAQPLQFYKEDIAFEIRDGYFYVNGMYYFCNNGAETINQVLFYPFPAGENYGEVDSIGAYLNRDTGSNLMVRLTPKGGIITVNLEPYGTAAFNVFYRQKIVGNKAEYILTTTQNWNRPFESATYSLKIPENYRLFFSSYPPDSSEIENNTLFYFWNKTNFMPDRNMIFEFREP